MATVYVVSEEAKVGITPRCVGIFSTREQAEAVLDAHEQIFDDVKFEITESELDENSEIYVRVMRSSSKNM